MAGQRSRPDGTNRTHGTDRTYGSPGLIPAHGGYRNLKSYQMAEIIYDATVAFCARFIDRYSRTTDQMTQAAPVCSVPVRASRKKRLTASLRASQASGTSKKTELKLTNVARASLEELLQDYQDFLRQYRLPLWPKDHPQAQAIRRIAYQSYRSYVETGSPELAANTLLCLIHQANYLLDHQLRSQEQTFLTEGGFTERLYHTRREHRDRPPEHRP